jgi:uncharacterized membrane protein YhhN
VSWALLGAALAFGLLHILADYRQQWLRTYFFKPVAMIAIIGLVFVDGAPDNPYRWWILAGLALSLAGDVFLMLRPARFLPGLFSFLLAHLAYISAFLYSLERLHWSAILPATAAGIIMLSLMWSGLRKLKIPVVIYIAAIVGMVAAATSAALDLPTDGRIAAAAGSVLFLGSDACIGLARFRRAFPAAQALILGSYYPAQALIALSAGGLYS